MQDHHPRFPVIAWRFQAKWAPVRVKKTRRNKELTGTYQSPGEMRRQWMIAGLAEEGGLLGGRFQELLVLGIDVVAELHGLVPGHPGRQVDPGDRHLLRQRDLLMPAGRDFRIDRRAIPF